MKLRFKGKSGNNFGIGAKVIIPQADTGKIVYELCTTRGFLSSVSPEIVIGLGKISTIDNWSLTKVRRVENMILPKMIKRYSRRLMTVWGLPIDTMKINSSNLTGKH